MLKDVDWDVDEIHLKSCDLSQLPNSPTSPTLVKLFLQVPGLTVIPPTFFDCMPVLKVLDLSNTSILSLPSSISSLSLLQEFFLRDCSALMELPTQIGMLTKLKLFDVEGTEIMYIPKEIGNLNDLECLRVSLSPYADYYIKTESIEDPIIPRMMISKLEKLKELCISVNPEAEWWEHEVEAIQHELCHLEALQTLKWYLPTNKVLQQFLRLERDHIPIYAYLSSFMLTIGQHAQLTSCLPCGLETKFEKFKKCLKCINGEGSMHDISIILGSAEALFLSRHWTIVKLSAFNIRKLKYCLLVECNQMQTLVDADELSEDGETGIEDGEKVGLASLQYLGIHYMKKLQSIWKGPIGKDSLSRLRILALHTCPELTTIFTRSVAENLLSLIELTVEDCPKVKSLISTESPNFKSGPLFPSLKKILLLDLPELVNMFDDLIILPKLDSMLVYNCLKLRCLSTTGLSHIKEIKGESEWWNALNCDKSKWINIFVQLKEKRDLVEQLDEATSSLQHFHDIVKISQWPGKGKKSFDWSDSQAPRIEADTSYASIETTADTSYASTKEDEGLFLSRQEEAEETEAAEAKPREEGKLISKRTNEVHALISEWDSRITNSLEDIEPLNSNIVKILADIEIEEATAQAGAVRASENEHPKWLEARKIGKINEAPKRIEPTKIGKINEETMRLELKNKGVKINEAPKWLELKNEGVKKNKAKELKISEVWKRPSKKTGKIMFPPRRGLVKVKIISSIIAKLKSARIHTSSRGAAQERKMRRIDPDEKAAEAAQETYRR